MPSGTGCDHPRPGRGKEALAMSDIHETIRDQARQAIAELLDAAKLSPGDLFVVGCSTSEVAGRRIGSDSSLDIAGALWDGIAPVLQDRRIFLAVQCCEHLNRAVVLERAAAEKARLELVNAVPQLHAGGAFAATAYARMEDPVMVEEVRAAAGIDIGGTLIGMQLRRVAVPVRLSIDRIGEARILCARTRPKFIGGVRAVYDESVL